MRERKKEKEKNEKIEKIMRRKRVRVSQQEIKRKEVASDEGNQCMEGKVGW